MTEEQAPERSGHDAERQRWPIGFVVLIGATALYLGWRLVQGIGVLIGWITS